MVPVSTRTLLCALINTIKKLKTFALQDMYKSEDFPKVFKATEEARASYQIFSLAVTSKSRKYRKPIIPTVFRSATHSWNSPHALSSTPPHTIKLAILAVKRRADATPADAGPRWQRWFCFGFWPVFVGLPNIAVVGSVCVKILYQPQIFLSYLLYRL